MRALCFFLAVKPRNKSRKSARARDESTIHAIFKKWAIESDFIEINGTQNPASAHSLRVAFRTALTNKIADPLIEYWMGHKLGDIGKTYINMGDADLRVEYKNAERHLRLDKTITTIAKDVTAQQGRKIAMLELLINKQGDELSKLADLVEQIGKEMLDLKYQRPRTRQEQEADIDLDSLPDRLKKLPDEE